QLAVMAAFAEQFLRMRLLEIAGTDLSRGNLCRDGEDRYPRAMAIEEGGGEMQVAGTATAGADRERAGEMRLGAGGEGGHFLMADMDPLDLALAAQGIGQAGQAVADDTIDAFDASGGERGGELIGDCLGHLSGSAW